MLQPIEKQFLETLKETIDTFIKEHPGVNSHVVTALKDQVEDYIALGDTRIYVYSCPPVDVPLPKIKNDIISSFLDKKKYT